METSPISSRRSVRAVLALCLIGSLLAFGFVLMRGNRPARVSSHDIPMPFGGGKGAATALRGQLTNLGSTNDNRSIVDMTFDNGEISEAFGTNDLTFVLTPQDGTTFSSGASLSLALTAGKKLYGYKYTSRDATIETDVATTMEASQGTGLAFYYGQRFPGTFFAPASELADPTSTIATFIREKDDVDHRLNVSSIDDLLLEPNARYLIIAESGEVPPVAGDTTITVRNLLWCGDGKIIAPEICDDGNRTDGDGCSAACATESGWICQAGTENLAAPFTSALPQSTCATCTDTDPTNDPNVAGVVTGTIAGHTNSYADECKTNAVTQWSCNSESLAANADTPCPFGCAAGVCLADTRTCGDGITQPDKDEQCDDGNTVDNDGCTACHIDRGFICNTTTNPSSCIATCGNGTTEILGADGIAGTPDDEQCDAGALNSDTAGCLTTCQIASGWDCTTASPSVCTQKPCGINIPDAGCEAGPSATQSCTAYGSTCDYCDASCQNQPVTGPYCGDGTIQTVNGEVCDNSAANGTVCTAAYAGTCTYCAADCKSEIPVTGPYCGDNIQQEAGLDGILGNADDEKCDDGNRINTDSCTNTCKNAVCGDGIQQEFGANGVADTNTITDPNDPTKTIVNPNDDDEDCDAGASNGTSSCTTSCKLSVPLPSGL